MKNVLALHRLVSLLGIGLLASTQSFSAQVSYEILKSFGDASQSGQQPSNPLIVASDGKLYGATEFGGTNGYGSVFCVDKDGRNFQLLHHFRKEESYSVRGPLLDASDGMLYGATYTGSHIFRLNKDGSGYTNLAHLYGPNGASPAGGLIEGLDGWLYGTTAWGGTSPIAVGGTFFKITKDGSDFMLLHTFTGQGEGSHPEGDLVQTAAGVIYGTTRGGGATNGGTLVRMNADGSDYGILHDFGLTPGDGKHPVGALCLGADSVLYGITRTGGTNDMGTLFKYDLNNSSYDILHHFDFNDPVDGYFPRQLTIGSDGNLYGTTESGSTSTDSRGIVFKFDTGTGVYTMLHSSANSRGDAIYPRGVVRSTDGFLYGVSSSGGGTLDGTIFKLRTDGSGFEILRALSGAGDDGRNPTTPLVQGPDGAWYGTVSSYGRLGFGIAFKLGPGTNYTILRHFKGAPSDGAVPMGGLAMDQDGILYGTTSSGGSADWGTVFRMKLDGGEYAVLHSFAGIPNDGAAPYAEVTIGSDGRLYGTTSIGVTNRAGTIFRMNKDGTDYTILHQFVCTTDYFGFGENHPFSPLIEGTDGALYGLAFTNGLIFHVVTTNCSVFKINNDGSNYRMFALQERYVNPGLVSGKDGWIYGSTPGSIFRIREDGSDFTNHGLTYSATGGGLNPVGGLVLARDGQLYGRTSNGGLMGSGTLFRATKSDLSDTDIYSFTNHNGNFETISAMREGVDGCFYGVTSQGGLRYQGEVYRLTLAGLTYGLLKRGPAGMELSWKSILGTRYGIEFKSKLTDVWDQLPGFVTGTGGIITRTNEIRGGQGFYRIVVLP